MCNVNIQSPRNGYLHYQIAVFSVTFIMMLVRLHRARSEFSLVALVVKMASFGRQHCQKGF
jgi:hypothetical protein